MTATSMESCRFVTRRSPGRRFWSVVDVRKRLHRVRHPFHQSIHIKQGAQPANQLEPQILQVSIQSSPEAAARGRGDYPTPDRSQSEPESRSAPEKSVQFGPDGAPFPLKTSITRGPPGIVIAVSSDPILPHR